MELLLENTLGSVGKKSLAAKASFPLLIGACLFLFMACKSSKKHSSTGKDSKQKVEAENKTSFENKKAEILIKTARSYVGTSYKYGGTSRAGIDCSGLTCASYKTIDILLPRTATEQSTFGKTVDLGDLRKGDLVFFTDKKGSQKITHVGMVTEVKNQGNVSFIHASTKVGVVEVELFSNYYKPLILKASRILK